MGLRLRGNFNVVTDGTIGDTGTAENIGGNKNLNWKQEIPT